MSKKPSIQPNTRIDRVKMVQLSCSFATNCRTGVLFVLGIELLSKAIKNEPTIKGIQVNKHELKISQYADDTTVFVRDLDSVVSLLKVLNEFEELSGLEINTTKTEAMWLGE